MVNISIYSQHWSPIPSEDQPSVLGLLGLHSVNTPVWLHALSLIPSVHWSAAEHRTMGVELIQFPLIESLIQTQPMHHNTSCQSQPVHIQSPIWNSKASWDERQLRKVCVNVSMYHLWETIHFSTHLYHVTTGRSSTTCKCLYSGIESVIIKNT